MIDEQDELITLQRQAIGKAKAALARGELGPCRGWLDIATELSRQYAHLTGEHLAEFEGPTDLDREHYS